jgi:hypothetical protein
MASDGRPLRIEWFMLHSGYIRYFGQTIRLLADAGHAVHLAFTRIEKDPGDAKLAHDLAASHPNVTIGEAPLRRRGDGWRPLAGLVRGLADLGRYVHPRYADAPALRARMAHKLTEHVRTARAVDPVTSRLTLRLIRFMESHTSERSSRRIVDALGLVEQAIPTCGRIDAYLRKRRPDAVLVTPVIEFASSQVEYVKSARKAGIPSGVAVASWDNLTGKGLIRVLPDRVLVWNEIQVEEAEQLHGVPRGAAIATGAAKFDEWFERRPRWTREELMARAGLDSEKPYVLYVCSSSFIAPAEVGFVRTWIERLRADQRPPLREVGVLVRPHPQNAAQWRGADLSGLANVSVWPRAGAQPDAGDARAEFFDSLAHSAAVVGINTSALLEAAILGKSVLVPLAPQFAGTQQGTLHFRYLLYENGGFLHVASTLDDHADQLVGALEHGDDHAEQTRRFVEAFMRPHGLGKPAAPILADAIEELASVAPEPVKGTPATTLFRALLTPAALAAAAIGGIAVRVRHGRPEPGSLVEEAAAEKLATPTPIESPPPS